MHFHIGVRNFSDNNRNPHEFPYRYTLPRKWLVYLPIVFVDSVVDFVYCLVLNIVLLLQPLCDGTHKLVVLKVKQRPIKFQVAETKEYWLCNCKQTTHRPFCDGTHKREDIQAAIR